MRQRPTSEVNGTFLLRNVSGRCSPRAGQATISVTHRCLPHVSERWVLQILYLLLLPVCYGSETRTAKPRQRGQVAAEGELWGGETHAQKTLLVKSDPTWCAPLVCCSVALLYLCHKKRRVWTDIRPSPVQVESEQRWTQQEWTASERSESDLFSGSEKKREIYKT